MPDNAPYLPSRLAAGEDPDDEPLPVPVWTAKAIAGIVCCLAAPLFDPIGYAMTLLGLGFIWHRSAFGLSSRLILTAVVLPPRLAPLVLDLFRGPGELSFVLSPPASSSDWGWYGLLWALSGLLVFGMTDQGRGALAGAGLDTTRENLLTLPAIVALGLVVWATPAVLHLDNSFEWVEAAGDGQWALKHTVRGTAATFSPAGVRRIDGVEEDGRWRVAFTLADGVARRAQTRKPSAWSELTMLAATMELPPGRMRLKPASGETWTNKSLPSGLKGWAGIYESTNGGSIRLRVSSGRLAGSQTVVGTGGAPLARPLWAVKVGEGGEIEYRTHMFSGSARNFALSFGFAQGRLDGDILEIDGAQFKKRPAESTPAAAEK